jgi:hypothetical protein
MLIEPAEIAHRAVHDLSDALLHFTGGFVGKRDGQDRACGNAQRNEIRDPAGDDAGFAATGAGDDQQRAIDVPDSLALLVGQIFQQCLGRDQTSLLGCGVEKQIVHYSEGWEGGR